DEYGESMGTITLRQVEKHLMVASDSNGHSVVIGKSPDPEHQWAGVKPSELLLMAVASCSAYDVIEILTKQRAPFRDLKVTCSGDQMSKPPYTFTRIHLRYELHGDVEPEKLARAIKLSQEKYCSVMATLRPDTSVSSEFEIFI
ncbi:MAG: OsmC family protein, partial [Anaerolineales bacterium]|nr:OsmC family protein [Anaerolineales bacterium]